jgi:thiol:disulfide interchange protein DsbD
MPETTTITETGTTADVEVKMPASTDGIRVNSLDFRKPLVDCGTEQVKKIPATDWYLFLVSRWAYCASYTMCIPNDSAYCFFLYKRSSKQAKEKEMLLFTDFSFCLFSWH